MKRLKIVHILPLIQPGGAENLVFNLARTQSREHDVTIIGLLPKTAFSLDDIPVIYLDKKVGFDFKTVISLYQTLRAVKPDIVHTHLYSALYAFPWFLLSRKRVGIHTVHSTANKEFGKIHRTLQKIAYRCLNVTPVAISDTIQNQMVEEYHIDAGKISLIYNAIDTKKFLVLGRTFENDTVHIVNVASLHPWKNQQLLIEAFYDICQKHKNVRLTLVGDGECRELLIQQTKKYHLDDKIAFAGLSHEVHKWLQKSDIFVLCSLYEGLPLSILEAFSAGLPVVATDVGGIKDVLEDGVNGILVKNNDRAALANALQTLIENNDLRKKMSLANAAKAPRYDIETAAKEYLDLYLRKIGENCDCRR